VNEGVEAFLPGFEEAVMFGRLRFDALPTFPASRRLTSVSWDEMTRVCRLETASAGDDRRLPGRDPHRATLASEAIQPRIARRRAEEEEPTRFSSASDDEVGGYKARSAPSELGE
jgi:hypothetical protein